MGPKSNDLDVGLLFARFLLLILVNFDLVQYLLQLILVLQELLVVLLVLGIDHLLLVFGRLASRFGLVILHGVLRIDLVLGEILGVLD